MDHIWTFDVTDRQIAARRFNAKIEETFRSRIQDNPKSSKEILAAPNFLKNTKYAKF